MKWIALLLSLSLLVMTHELGHLGFAKLFRTRVRRYYIFFNWKFSILKAKKFGGKWHFLFFNSKTPDSWDEKNLAPEDQDNTLWGIGWIPLGGYCDIAGMIDETKDEKGERATAVGVSNETSMAAPMYHQWWCIGQLLVGIVVIWNHIQSLGKR